MWEDRLGTDILLFDTKESEDARPLGTCPELSPSTAESELKFQEPQILPFSFITPREHVVHMVTLY